MGGKEDNRGKNTRKCRSGDCVGERMNNLGTGEGKIQKKREMTYSVSQGEIRRKRKKEQGGGGEGGRDTERRTRKRGGKERTVQVRKTDVRNVGTGKKERREGEEGRKRRGSVRSE